MLPELLLDFGDALTIRADGVMSGTLFLGPASALTLTQLLHFRDVFLMDARLTQDLGYAADLPGLCRALSRSGLTPKDLEDLAKGLGDEAVQGGITMVETLDFVQFVELLAAMQEAWGVHVGPDAGAETSLIESDSGEEM